MKKKFFTFSIITFAIIVELYLLLQLGCLKSTIKYSKGMRVNGAHIFGGYNEKHGTSMPPHNSKDRIAIICFIGQSDLHIKTFLTMLYGSWRFINEERNQFKGSKKINTTNEVDLVAFCEPSICKEISIYCTVIESLQSITVEQNTPKCWAILHHDNLTIPYTPLNSYIMFNRSDISHLEPRYKYLLKSDYDVFVTPALLLYKPRKNLMFGIGGYSNEFNNERLMKISTKLGLVHRGIHKIGSTWLGETELLIMCARKALELTVYMFLNEFEPNLPGLEEIDIANNPNGKWQDWWKPVSSMYGGDVALNHMLKDISSANREPFDAHSCAKETIWSTPHVHCLHTECEFSKFNFLINLQAIIDAVDGFPGALFHIIIENMYAKDISNMTIHEYSTHVAWNSVGRYLKKWFVA